MSRKRSNNKTKFSLKHFYKRRKQSTLPKELSHNSSEGYAIINKEEMDVLSRYILDYRNIETGGQLFGYWTFDGNPVVLFVLGPGPKAGHYGSYFMQDIEYLKSRASFLKNKYGLDHIGEWHSHHQLGLSHPSGHDSRNMFKNIRRLGYSRFLLCIGTCTNLDSSINAFMFSSDKDNYSHVPWVIKNINSPYRNLINDSEIDSNQFVMPQTINANMQRLYIKGTSKLSEKISFKNMYWLKRDGNSKILKNIIDSITITQRACECVPTIDEKQEVHLEIYQGNILLEDIHFPEGFPIEPPVISDSNGNITNDSSLWYFDGDIFNSFTLYYQTFHK